MKTVCLLSRRYKHDLVSIAILFCILVSLLVIGPSVSLIRNRSGTIKDAIQNSNIVDNSNVNLLSSDTLNTASETERSNSKDFIYLSDIPYMPNISKTAYSTIQLDKNLSGGLITVLVDGKPKMFLKGIFAHANATVAYDLSGYDYDYLTAYLGVDTFAGNNGNGVRFEVHTSDDGENWTLQDRVNNNAVFKGNTDAYFLKYPVKGIKYIKFVIQDHGGNNTSDHSVLANAKLVKEGYEDDTSATVNYIKTVSEYDKIIKGYNTTNLDKNQEFVLLQRTFVKNVGYDLLQTMAVGSSSYNETISWLFNNYDNLRLYVLGGTPDGGSYSSSLIQLDRLYHRYKNDFNDTTPTNNPWYPNLTKGEVYKKMAISLSLTHSTAVGYWAQINHPSNRSDALVRYQIFKDLYDNGQFVVSSRQDHTPWFEALHVEEMRYIMNSIIDDEEILWFNEYTQTRIDAHPNQEETYLQPHTYIAYVWPNFQNPIYHDPANYEYFDELFDGIFSKYGVTYSSEGDMVYKAWMSMRNKWGTGAVCGGISKLGTHIRAAHGTPASVISQPGHAAIIYYRKLADGRGYWTIDNDVSGWAQSGKTERLSIRMPLGWGNDSYVSGWAATYIILAQEALNDVANYEKSEELIMLADVYKDNTQKYEEILREALKVQNINIDAWWGLIQSYKNDNTRTEEDYYRLAEEMAEALLPFPLPLYNLYSQISGKFTSTEYRFKFTILQGKVLNDEKNYTASDRVVQPSITRTVGAYLLGQTDISLATFSFDGDKAGKIVLADRFNGNGIRWDYSIDGKNTWKEVSFSADEDHEYQLSKEELALITPENDLYVHIVGVNYDEENLYKIDILESAGLPTNLYANDLENRMIDTIPTIKWRYSNSDEWTYYKDQVPDLSGDVTITLKAGATGVYVESKDEKTYTFTANTDTDSRKYISIDNLSLHSVSSEATGQGRHAKHMIDGNINTTWHSDWNGGDRTKEIVIEFNEPKNLTALEYIPAGGGNGKIESASILVSVDGESWNEVVSGTNWTYANSNDVSMKSVDFPAAKAKYVKIVGKKTQSASSSLSFITGAMFNFYEDTTVVVRGTFAFDGNKPGTIVLDKESYDGLSWRYSLDSGATWKSATGGEHTLTSAEIESINDTDQIKLMFTNDTRVYSLPIKKSEVPSRATYVNDLENRLIGVSNSSTLEWKIKDTNDSWKSYDEEEPVVSGNNTLLVRTKATGINQASDPIEYNFTEDTDSDTRKYISVKHLSIHGYSTQSIDSGRPFYAPNAIDGNPETLWHTDFRYDVRTQSVKPYLTIKLDKPKYISGVDFTQKKYKVNDPDYIKNAIVYVSEDGENWVEAGRLDNCPQDLTTKSITFDESQYAHYVKFEMDTYNIFASVSMLNLYEDVTKNKPTVTVDYSTDDVTNEPVIATLISDKDITVTNNNGEFTYTFTENGTFTFEYEDNDGNTGNVVAVVDYIDTTAPVGTINYSTRDVTNQNVQVTLATNEEVEITNNDGSPSYTFEENGEFTFEFIDKAGNTGTATAYVTWISKTAPIGTITYSINSLTNKDVVATLTTDEKVTITNNKGLSTYTFTKNDTFTFEYVGESGNRGTATATVTWINKATPTVNVSYSTTKETTNPVTVTIANSSTEITITNNDGKSSYTFTKNGEFTFEFVDKAGNKGTKTVTVDWIKEQSTTPSTPSVKPGNEPGAGDGDEPTPSEPSTPDEPTPVEPTDPEEETKVELVYSTDTLTNQDVTVTLISDKPITIKNNNGKNEYTFTKNDTFTFEYVDGSGKVGTVVATVNWIDKVAPKGQIKYDISEETEGNVTATLGFDEDVTITNNGGSNRYTFTHNGEFTFEFVDKAGNKGSAKAIVDWIVNPNLFGELVYSESSATNKDVIVTLQVNDGISILGGVNTHTFKENGKFNFVIADEYGNKKTITAVVNWIDKTSPVGNVSYSLTTPTNGNVIAMLETNEEVTITNNKGLSTYEFTDNGKFVFEFIDKAGNKGTAEAIVDWIDKEAPIGNVTYNVKDLTNKDVTATLIVEDGVKITNNGGENTYVFKENGKFVFEFVDELGNIGSASAIVDWIDKKAPVGEITYSITKPTYESIIVTLKTNEDVTVLNNSGKFTYVFNKNGKFTFEFVDKAGNKGTATATVSWITEDEVVPNPPVEPSVPSEPVNPSEPVVPIEPETPVEPSKPSVPEEVSKPTQSGNTTTTKPSNNGGSTVVSNTNTGNKNTTTTTSNKRSTTTTTKEVKEKTTTTTSAVDTDEKDNQVEIKVPEEETENTSPKTGINYKIIIGCLVVFLFFVATLVSLYVRK